MPYLFVGVPAGESHHRGARDAVVDEFEEHPVGMERHVDDEIGGRWIETGGGSTVAASLNAVTGGAGLGVDTVAYGERFRVGRKRIAVARCGRFPELRGEDDSRPNQEHDEAGSHDGQPST